MISPYKWPSGWPREKQPLLLGGATGQGGEGRGVDILGDQEGLLTLP